MPRKTYSGSQQLITYQSTIQLCYAQLTHQSTQSFPAKQLWNTQNGWNAFVTPLKSSFFTVILRKSCVLRIVIYAVLFCFKKFYARAGLLPFVIGFKNFGLFFLAERSTRRSTKCFLYRLSFTVMLFYPAAHFQE